MLLYFSLTTLILSLLLIYHNYSINKNSVYLSGLLILISISGLIHYFVLFSSSENAIAFFYTHFMPLLYLQGPLLYFYVVGTLQDTFTFKKKWLIHFIPSFIGLISIVTYYFKPWSYKLAIAKQIIASPLAFLQNPQSGNLFLNLPARTALLMLYAIVSIVMVIHYCIQNKTRIKQIFSKDKTILWLFFIIITIIVSTISYMILIVDFVSNQIPTRELINQLNMNIVTLISFSLIPVIILFFPSVLYGLPKVKNENKYNSKNKQDTNKTELKVNAEVNNDLIDLALLIQEYLKNEKPFVDPQFSLDDLAKQLDVPKHHLYYCFNTLLNKKFSSIRKEMRVAYAKELLLNGNLKNQSMQGIWTNAGFSSKTNFFISFKEVTGSSPLEYLKNRN
jgi:AraC-like DNA-binding protein